MKRTIIFSLILLLVSYGHRNKQGATGSRPAEVAANTMAVADIKMAEDTVAVADSEVAADAEIVTDTNVAKETADDKRLFDPNSVDFDALAGTHVVVQFDKTINGYAVVVDWWPYATPCKANFTLLKDGRVINGAYSDNWWTYDLYCRMQNSYSGRSPIFQDGEVVTLAYAPPTFEYQEMLDALCPIYFADVDFDGVDEFIIGMALQGARSSSLFKAFEIQGNRLVLKTKAPFDDMQDVFTRFDANAKTISQRESDGVFYSKVTTYHLTTGKVDVEEKSFDGAGNEIDNPEE